ncbi:MAG: hypothetical protein VXW65_03740, partial [Pseudomonadota bacterium]|nr:hypothetical protein [Pseudomonadota bacterium]
MPNQRRMLCLLSVATLFSMSAVASPVLTHGFTPSEQSFESVLNAPIIELWSERDALTESLNAAGLSVSLSRVLDDEDGHDHAHHDHTHHHE